MLPERSQIGKHNTGKYQQHTDNMYPGKLLMQNDHSFEAAENGYQVAKQSSSAGA